MHVVCLESIPSYSLLQELLCSLWITASRISTEMVGDVGAITSFWAIDGGELFSISFVLEMVEDGEFSILFFDLEVFVHLNFVSRVIDVRLT
jgi:hypothetical protein